MVFHAICHPGIVLIPFLLVSDCFKCDCTSFICPVDICCVSVLYRFDFLQVPTTNPTHHPASTIRSRGSRFTSLLQKHHWIRHLARNLRSREKASKAPSLLLDSETLWVQHICYREDDTADPTSVTVILQLSYGSNMISSRLIHTTTAPEQTHCWVTEVLLFSSMAVVLKTHS